MCNILEVENKHFLATSMAKHGLINTCCLLCAHTELTGAKLTQHVQWSYDNHNKDYGLPMHSDLNSKFAIAYLETQSRL